MLCRDAAERFNIFEADKKSTDEDEDGEELDEALDEVGDEEAEEVAELTVGDLPVVALSMCWPLIDPWMGLLVVTICGRPLVVALRLPLAKVDVFKAVLFLLLLV